MILDQLIYASAYDFLGERFAAGFTYLKSADLDALPSGRYEIDGTDVFALVQRYASKPVDQCRWEAHRRYADIQYIARGEEQMGIASLGDMTVETPHDADKDIAFFTGTGQLVTVPHGAFTVFLPHDVHMPGVAAGGPADVVKVVIKIRLA